MHNYLTHTRLGRNTVGEGGGWGGEGRHRPRILSAPPSRCPSSTLFGSTAHSCNYAHSPLSSHACAHIRHCLHMLVRMGHVSFRPRRRNGEMGAVYNWSGPYSGHLPPEAAVSIWRDGRAPWMLWLRGSANGACAYWRLPFREGWRLVWAAWATCAGKRAYHRGRALAEAADAEVAARERERNQAVVEEFLRYAEGRSSRWRDELLEEEETYFRRRDEDYHYYRTGGH